MFDYLKLENKKIRSVVIKKYLEKNNINKVVCFSCGNASKELKKVGLDVLDISPNGDLNACRWFNSNEINYYFKDRFNATSGYLPFDLMNEISIAFKKELGDIRKVEYIATGSGETLICLKLAYPENEFIAVYDNKNLATRFDKDCPLNKLVKLLAKEVIINE